jgi:hypothetical protein
MRGVSRHVIKLLSHIRVISSVAASEVNFGMLCSSVCAPSRKDGIASRDSDGSRRCIRVGLQKINGAWLIDAPDQL